MNILQSIFTDYYEHILYELHPRPAVIENVNKMIHCGDPSHGVAMYGCPHCGNLKFVPFRCHSRFCPFCGNKYNQIRSFQMSCKLVSCVHRHCVFTIPEELRIYFLRNRTLLNLLFSSVRDVVLRMFFNANKSECFTPGFICVLHTFGRDLKWNPHIHALISEGGAGNFTVWRPFKHFNFTFLRNAFGKVLLEKMTKAIGPSFRKIKMRSIKNIPKVSMSGLNQIFALLMSLSNTSVNTLAAPLSLPHASINMMANLLLSTTHGTKITKPLKNAFPLWTLPNASSSISPKNISKCSDTMASMPNTIDRNINCADVYPMKRKSF